MKKQINVICVSKSQKTLVPVSVDVEIKRNVWERRTVLKPRKTVMLLNARYLQQNVYNGIKKRFPVDAVYDFNGNDLTVRDPNGKYRYRFRTYDADGQYA